jgi:serine-type D-Ala-D-Ala carboxypeptidase (penicillin-binding protein 5/6)
LRKWNKLLAVCLALVLFLPLQQVLADDYLEEEPVVGAFAPEKMTVGAKPPRIDAQAGIVMDLQSGRVLYEKNAYTKKSIASTTKIMTAILALENGNLDDTVTVSKRAAAVWGSSVGLKTGQSYKLRDLLYALLLRSGNDAAIAIAEHIGGSVEEFANMMNSKAAELGANSTSFRSPHGLDAQDHYSTACDLALMARYALNNPVFSQIVGSRSAYFSGKEIGNTNELLGLYPGADGVKTGYTGQAGRCLVASATRNDWRIISVVLGCPTRSKRALSSKNILDYAFINFKPQILLSQGEFISEIPVYKGNRKSVEVTAAEQIVLPLKEEEAEGIERIVELPDMLEAPVMEGDTVGTLKFVLSGEVLAQSPLQVTNPVRRLTMSDYFDEVLQRWYRLMK